MRKLLIECEKSIIAVDRDSPESQPIVVRGRKHHRKTSFVTLIPRRVEYMLIEAPKRIADCGCPLSGNVFENTPGIGEFGLELSRAAASQVRMRVAVRAESHTEIRKLSDGLTREVLCTLKNMAVVPAVGPAYVRGWNEYNRSELVFLNQGRQMVTEVLVTVVKAEYNVLSAVLGFILK